MQEKVKLKNSIQNIDFSSMESEVKVIYKNLSGTIDLVLDGNIVLDFKTGKEANIAKKIRNPDDWKVQLSIYSYLLSKQRNIEMNTIGYVAWLSVDTQKLGVVEIDLYTKAEVLNLIKQFMADIKKEPEEFESCDGCKYWRYRWCGVRSVCPFWNEDREVTVDEW